MQLRFVKSESTFTYFEAIRGYLEKDGTPLTLYSDKASVFRINNKNATGVYIAHLKLTMTWQRFSHGGNRDVFQNP